MPPPEEKTREIAPASAKRSRRWPIALVVLPCLLAPVVARLIPSWYLGGAVTLLLAVVAGLVAFLVLVVRLFRRARPNRRVLRTVIVLAAPVALALWLVVVVSLVWQGNPRSTYFCGPTYRPEIVQCGAWGPEIYYQTYTCFLGGLDYRVYVRDSFLPFYRRYGEIWYLREEDLPGATELCAELGHPLGP